MRTYRGYRPRYNRRKWPDWMPYNPLYWSSPELAAAHAALVQRFYWPGRRSTWGGRSHLPQLSPEAKARRRKLAWVAYHLRVCNGLSLREIAAGLDVSYATAQRWLAGVPRTRQN
jgi:hypothetical protein